MINKKFKPYHAAWRNYCVGRWETNVNDVMVCRENKNDYFWYYQANYMSDLDRGNTDLLLEEKLKKKNII